MYTTAASGYTREDGLESPGGNAIAVTPSDSTNLTNKSRALYVGGAGNVSVVMAEGGNTVVFQSVPAGTVLPIRVSRVNSTSTTATNIVAIW